MGNSIIGRRWILMRAQKHAQNVNRAVYDDLLFLKEIFLKTRKKTNSDALTYEEFEQKIDEMVEEIEHIDRKKLKFPQLRANKMLVLLKKAQTLSKQDYYNFIKDGAGFNETEYFGPNIREKKYIPNFDKEEDRKFSDGTIATIALVYLVNISKMTNKPFNQIISNTDDCLYDTRRRLFRKNKQVVSLIKPILLTKSDKEQIHSNENSFCYENKFYTIGKGYEFGGYQLPLQAKETVIEPKEMEHEEKDKFRREDCSSWVSKIAKIDRISTKDMMTIHDKKAIDEMYGELKNKVKNAGKKLKVIGKYDIKPGDIVCFTRKSGGGHAGIIKEINKLDNTIDVISYTRDDNLKYEGIGIQKYNLDDQTKTYKFFRKKSVIEQLSSSI